MPSFSISKIGSYETCRLQYKYTYIDRVKVETEDTIETFLGSRVHEVLEKLYRDKRFEKLISLEDLLAYYNDLWRENWKDSIVIVRKDYTQENYRKMGEHQLKDYYIRYKPFNEGKIIGLETKDFLALDKDRKYTFHIRIDRLMDIGDGVYELHDYKTGSTLPKQEDLDRDRQLAMYSLWVKRHFKDFKKTRLVWHFLAFDKELDSLRTEDQLEDLRKEIIEEIKEIETNDEFPAHVSSLCDWCLYRGICPMWKHEEQLEEKPENEYFDDPGLKLVDEYVRIRGELDETRKEAEEKLEKIKEALVAFSKKEEASAIFGSENKVTVKEYDSYKLPGRNTEEREELVKLLKKMGKLDEISELDLHALSRILTNREWDKQELEQLKRFYTVDKNVRLSISKK